MQTRSSRRRDRVSWLAAVVAVVGVLLAAPGLAPPIVRDALGVALPWVDTDGSHAFTDHQPGRPGDPVAWDPCRAIQYVVNPEGGPSDAVDLVSEAVEEAARASGLEFRYGGLSERRPRQGRISGSDLRQPVLIAWATADEVPRLEDIAGLGGAVAVTGDDGVIRYTTGAATLSTESFRRMESEPRGRALQRAVVMHELGHVLGLTHVDDPAELMHEDNVGRVAYGRGDRKGLERLGSGRCR